MVDDESFDLEELEVVARVDGLVAVAAPRHDDPDRRVERLHRAHLDRAGVGAQDRAVGGRLQRPITRPLGDVDRVPQVARRMVGRDVQRLEVHRVGLDLRPLEHLEAEAVQDLAQIALDRHRGMEMPDADRAARRGHVDRLGCQPLGRLTALERGQLRADLAVERHAQCVGCRADRRSLGGVDAAQRAQDRGQLAVSPGDGGPNGVDLGDRRRSFEARARLGADRLEGGPQRGGIGLLGHRSILVGSKRPRSAETEQGRCAGGACLPASW